MTAKFPAKHDLTFFIQSQNADPAPPLGTVLGNLGVNTVNFCKEFNSFTADLPPYFTLTVKVEVFSNRSYKFSLGPLAVGPLIRLLSVELPAPPLKKNKKAAAKDPTKKKRPAKTKEVYRSLPLTQAIKLAR